jgi:penicillin G amidase
MSPLCQGKEHVRPRPVGQDRAVGDAYEIVRDVDGIPHVRAGSSAGAFEGQGRAAAEDRLWQMCLDRWRALGRLASVVGPTAVPGDVLHRRLAIGAAARRSWAALGGETRTVLEAYATGVNDAMRSHGRLPPELELLGVEPEPWEGWHSLAVYAVRHLAMGTYETKLWRSGLVRRLGPETAARLWPSVPEVTVDPDDAAVTVASSVAEEMAACAPTLDGIGTAGDLGSNNLALSGSRTRSGRPLLAGDPHRALDLPNVYWQNHLTSADPDDPLDAVGLSFPGVPGFPHFGHNREVAWCITHGMADDQDLYVERFRRTDAGLERATASGWEPVDSREETIEVAGGEPAVVTCLSTANGPVIGGDDLTGIALRWTALDGPDTTADALLPMLRATTVDDLDAAFAPWVLPVNNVLMADTRGSIAYRMRGRLARRRADNGWTAVPGDGPARGWEGHVEDRDLPRFRDPGSGVLVTANNRVTTGGPYVSHDWAHPARATTIRRLLEARSDWDVGTVTTLLGDTHSPVAASFSDRVLALDPGHPAVERARDLFRGWDHCMDAGSAAAALYGQTRAELVRILAHELRLVDDHLPRAPGPSLHQTLRFVNSRLAFWVDDPGLVSDAALRSAVHVAVRTLELAQGPDPRRWRWGEGHRAMFVHPLAALRPDLAAGLVTPDDVELAGDNECVLATSTAPPSTSASNGPAARYVFDLSDWDRSAWVVPHGVSGDPRSAHHLDQLESWSRLQMRPMRFSDQAVDAATVSVHRHP